MTHNNRFASNWNAPNEFNQNNNRPPAPLPFARQQLVCYGCNRPGHKIRYCNYTAGVNGCGTGAHTFGSGGSTGGSRAARTNRYNPLAQHNRFDNSLAGHRTNRISGHNGAQPFHRRTNYQMNGTGQYQTNTAYVTYGGNSRPSGDRGQSNNVRLQANPSAPPPQLSPFTAQSYEQMTTSLTYAMCNWVSSNMQLFVMCVQQSLATMAPPTEIQPQQPQPDLSGQVPSSSRAAPPKATSKPNAQ